MSALEKNEVTRREVTITDHGTERKVIVEEFRDRNGFYASEILGLNSTGERRSLSDSIKAIDDSLKDALKVLVPSLKR